MLSRARTAALWGVEAFAVECEVDVGPGQQNVAGLRHPIPEVAGLARSLARPVELSPQRERLRYAPFD